MGRYEILTKGNAEYYMPGCPVILQSYAVISDSAKKQVLAQFKFLNISVRNLKKVVFDLECVRSDGSGCEGVRQCAYSTEEIKSHEIFGNNIPFYLPDVLTREIRIKYMKIIFMDGSIWENLDGECFQELPAKELIRNVLEEPLYERFEQKQAESRAYAEAIYVPWKIDGIWLCACGTYNTVDSEECFHCHQQYDSWNEKLSREQLENLQQEHIEIKKIEIEQKVEVKIEKIKGVRTIKISAAIMAILVVLVILSVNIFIPMGKYMKASNLMKKGDYAAAQELYKALDGYKDSSDKEEEAQALRQQDRNYNRGVEGFEANDYAGAVVSFRLAGEYKDARKYLNKAAYESGLEWYEKADYREASRAWENIDDQGMLNELEQKIEMAEKYCIYGEGVRLAESGEIQSACDTLAKVEKEIKEAADLKEQLTAALQNWFVGRWEIRDVNIENELVRYMYIWPIYENGEIKYICPWAREWEFVEKSLNKDIAELYKYLLQDGSLVLEGEENIKNSITREGDEVKSLIEHSSGSTSTDLYQRVSEE